MNFKMRMARSQKEEDVVRFESIGVLKDVVRFERKDSLETQLSSPSKSSKHLTNKLWSEHFSINNNHK